MFSLIITIVSIALVVALVAATMYHGGDTLTQGRNAASASAFVNGAEQIAGGYKMHQALNGQYANSVADLVTAGMLSAAPTGLELVPADSMGAYGAHVRTAETQTIEVCRELDKMNGRAPTVSEAALPAKADFASWPAIGCYKGATGIALEFKV